MSLTSIETFDWSDGRLANLSAGQTARCAGLVKGQLYAILLYNTSQADINADVTVVWSNDVAPSTVTVPGTTAEAGPATFVFVSGNDTDFVSISLGPGTEATIAAFVVSISMPLNTEGLNSAELPSDGQFHPFNKYDRYYTGPATGWRRVTIQNMLTQFISLQILERSATVIVVNKGAGITPGQVNMFGPTAKQSGTVQIVEETFQSYPEDIQGGGGTWVWMNGDSPQNSESAQIALQQLSAIEVFLKITGLSRLSQTIRRAVGY